MTTDQWYCHMCRYADMGCLRKMSPRPRTAPPNNPETLYHGLQPVSHRRTLVVFASIKDMLAVRKLEMDKSGKMSFNQCIMKQIMSKYIYFDI